MPARRVEQAEINEMRDLYRQEMDCQIVHDSIHARAGWTAEYMLTRGNTEVGYGSVAVAGPWKERPTIYEFFVLPEHRTRVFDLFSILVASTGATAIETQTNDPLLPIMLHAFAHNVTPESILFHDKLTTALAAPKATFRRVSPEDSPQIARHELDVDAKWVVDVDDIVAAAGDILFHYNRPYGDVYMKVAEPFRRRGVGSFLVQELKRVCYEQGSVPTARCNPKNNPSQKTLQAAGFVPCGMILKGLLSR